MHGFCREKFFNTASNKLQRSSVRTFEFRKFFDTAAAFHVIVIHRQKLQ